MAMEWPTARHLPRARVVWRRRDCATEIRGGGRRRGCWYRRRSSAAALVDDVSDLVPVGEVDSGLHATAAAEAAVLELEAGALGGALRQGLAQAVFNQSAERDAFLRGDALGILQQCVGNLHGGLHM